MESLMYMTETEGAHHMCSHLLCHDSVAGQLSEASYRRSDATDAAGFLKFCCV
jgi:hypothetical protein